MFPLIPLLLLAPLAWQSTGVQPGAPQSPLPPGSSKAEWKLDHFVAPVDGSAGKLIVEVSHVNGQQVDLFVRFDAQASPRNFDFKSADPTTAKERVEIEGDDLQTGNWHIAILHPLTVAYDIHYWTESAGSQHEGMGAIVKPDGTSFRVWAPNATAVNLAGGFNGWSGQATPMIDEGDGNWSVFVRGAGHGEHYQYVINTGSGVVWRNDPRAMRVTNSIGDSVVVDHGDFDWSGVGFSTPAWNDFVIYEMHIGTFNPGSSPTVGNFEEAIAKLDYLQSLGVTAIEVMPICEFAGDNSWGYNYSHPFSVESAYGSPADFKTFVKEAHRRGMAVFLDVVYNHWGPSDMDLWQFDGWSGNGFGGIYFFNDDRAITPWGDTRPDFTRGEVRQYIRDNALQWLEDYWCDGLRWDSTSYMRNGNTGDIGEAWTLMQWINDEINSRQGWKISIAEDMWSNEWITKPTWGGGAGFDAQWDPNFVHPIRDVAIQPSDSYRDMWAVKNAIEYRYNGDAFGRVIYTESHDETSNGKSRLPEDIWPGNADSYYSKKRSTMVSALTFTAPGIPMLFQGQEFLEDGFFNDDRPLDWSKATTFRGIALLYRDLISLRRNLSGTTAGLKGQGCNVFHVNNAENMIAFHRWDQGGVGDDVVVVVNMSNSAQNAYDIGLPSSGNWKVRFNSDWLGYDAFFTGHHSPEVSAQSGGKDGLPNHGTISIGPYTALILSR